MLHPEGDRFRPQDGVIVRLFCSGSQGLARALNHLLQMRTAVLAGVQALAMLGDAGMVDDGETETAFAGSQDAAVKRCKCTG